MSHLVAFGFHVPPAFGDRRCHNRNLINHLEVISVIDEGVCLLGVVGQETYRRKPKIFENLQADAVIARVGSVTKRGVGLNGIEPLILQTIGANLFDQADSDRKSVV